MNTLENTFASIKNEFISNVNNVISSSYTYETLKDIDLSELHNYYFNEDYYIIGYYDASQWIKKHDLDVWDLMQYVYEQNNDLFCDFNPSVSDFNPEYFVNQFVYFASLEYIDEIYESALETLEEEQKSSLLDEVMKNKGGNYCHVIECNNKSELMSIIDAICEENLDAYGLQAILYFFETIQVYSDYDDVLNFDILDYIEENYS